MVKWKLLKISYKDGRNGINLTAYADTLVMDESDPNKKRLVMIRFGGDPEPVRGMADAIYGGGDIDVETQDGPMTLTALTKQYKRQIGRDGVYAEATLTAMGDANVAAKGQEEKAKSQENTDEQTEITLPPRTCYFFCPKGDEVRLFEDIDQKVSVPLIPEFREYFLGALRQNDILRPLTVWSCSEQFEAWTLRCTKNDQNLADVLNHGLAAGSIYMKSLRWTSSTEL